MSRFDIFKGSRDSIRRRRSEARRRGLRPAPRLEGLEGRLLLTGSPTVYTVTSTGSNASVAGSLPYEVALANANTNTAGSVIQFNLGGTGPRTITLGHTLTLSETAGPETIVGPAGGVTISGNDKVEVFSIASGVNAVLDDLTIANGSATTGGGIESQGKLDLSDCTVTGNTATSTGGGLFTRGTATISNSTFASNTAAQGGGIDDDQGSLVAVNATIAENRATAAGGGGGLDVAAGSSLLANTIVALNTAGSSEAASDIVGTVASSSSYDLIGTGGGGGLTNGTDHNQVGANPMLSPLGSNGGPTQTMALLSSSPALGAGSSSIAGVTVPTTDQRGVARPSTGVDIGAFQALGSTKVTLPDRSNTNVAPAVVSFNGDIVIAWTGTNNQLNVESSSDGVDFSNKVTLNQFSNMAPALGVFDGKLFLAWRDQSTGGIDIESSSDGVHFGNEVTINTVTWVAPALTTFDGKLFVAWTDAGTGWLDLESSSDGVNFGNEVFISTETSNLAPALDVFDGSLFIAWTGTNGQLNVESSSDGVDFGNKVTLSQTSDFSPTLAVFDGSLVIGWTSTNGRLNVESSSNGTTFGDEVTLSETSDAAPSLAVFDGALATVWTGTDTHLNVEYLWTA